MSLTLAGHGQTILKLDFDSAADGTFTSGTVYTPSGTEIENTAAVGIGPAVIRFVDSGLADAANEGDADGGAIGTPTGVRGTGQGGKALLLSGGNVDEGLRVIVGDQLTSQSFTMETVWYTNDSIGSGSTGLQTIIGDSWPQLDLFPPNVDPRRSQFFMQAQASRQMRYSADSPTTAAFNLQGKANADKVWVHDAQVFTYNAGDPANSQIAGYRNGNLVARTTYNAATGEDVGLFGMTTATLNQHWLTIGMNNSFEYRINDHRRSLNGGIDAVAVTKGALAPAAFVLPYDDTKVANGSFELDPVPGYPGYTNAISNWERVGGTGTGLNNSAGPFMDNGVIPDGSKLLLLQQACGVTQWVPGFVAGEQYGIRLRVNARNANAPTVKVSINGVEIVAPTTVTPVGGTNAFRLISQNFASPGDGAFLLRIENTLAAGDNTLLVDQVEIGEPTTAVSDWSLFH